MRIHDFVRDHVSPVNTVIFSSVTVAGILDFLAPRAPFLSWLSYVLAGLVLSAMVLEVRARRAGTTGDAWFVRVLARLRAPPGPLWKSPGWQVFGIIVVIALVLGQASKARADGGGLIASAAPSVRNMQMLLLGVRDDTQHIRATVDGMAPKVDAIQASVGTMEAMLKEPRDYLAEGDYPYLQKLVSSGKKLPQDQWMLMLGLNQKRSDRLDLLRLYVDHGLDIRQPMPVLSNVVLGSRIDDMPTLRNLDKLDAWAAKRTQMRGVGLAFVCDRMDLLAYAYIADDKPLADWLIQQGLNPQQQYSCGFSENSWTMSSQSLQAVLVP
jgi:hypothetical protein